VNDPIEEEALGEGWSDTPATFEFDPDTDAEPQPPVKLMTPAPGELTPQQKAAATRAAKKAAAAKDSEE
jgi:hypothetical protein